MDNNEEIEELFEDKVQDYPSSNANNPKLNINNEILNPNSINLSHNKIQINNQSSKKNNDINNKLKSKKQNKIQINSTNNLLKNKFPNKKNNNDDIKNRIEKSKQRNRINHIPHFNSEEKINAEQVQNKKSINKLKAKTSRFTKKSFSGVEIKTVLSVLITRKIVIIGIILAMIFLVFFISIVLVVTNSTLESDESDLNSNPSVKSYVIGEAEDSDLVDTLIYMNLCSNEPNRDLEIENCMNSPAGKFFQHLKEINENYSNYKDINGNSIELNTSLILETISYGISDIELFEESNLQNIITLSDELAEAEVEHYQEFGDLYTKNGETCSVTNDKIVIGSGNSDNYYRISNDKYISYLLYGKVHENYSNQIRYLDVDIHPDSESSCVPDDRSYDNKQNITETTYTGNIQDGYLYKNSDGKYNITDESSIKNITSEIFERSEITLNNGSFPGGNNNISGINSSLCTGVVVTGIHAGVYSLEDYVAGVVQNENAWYEGDNIENMKAQAVAARTYVLRRTNNCTTSIANSTSTQTMNPNPSAQAIRAAQETAGEVLKDADGNYISTEYDALAVKEKTDKYYILKQNDLKIPVDWIDSHISSKSLDYYSNHNHGRGMSQWGSRYLQTIGYKYDQILSTFYSYDSMKSEQLIIGDTPTSIEDLKNRYYFTYDIESYSGKNAYKFGQCVWYAKHRAMEILSTTNYDETTKNILINSIKTTPGNGIDWYNNPDSKYFKKSKNINDVKAGSIVSWAWNDQAKINRNEGNNYGHVAIVEKVYEKNGQTMVTLTEGYRTTCSSGWCSGDGLWTAANFRKVELNLSKLRTWGGSFNGYVYLY